MNKKATNHVKADPFDSIHTAKTVTIQQKIMAQTFTVQQVAENNGCNNKRVWVIVRGVVYDITDFLEKHPGGDELIMEYAGRDGTKAFNAAGHSSDAIAEMKNYKIGIVQQEQSTNTFAKVNKTEIETIDRVQKKKRIKLFFCF